MKPGIKIIVAAVALPSAASAELISQESFSGYGLGQLPIVMNPAVPGYTGNWTGADFGDAKPVVSAGSLTYSGANYATGLGNKASVPFNNTGGEINGDGSNSGRAFRLFDETLAVTDTTSGVRYLSFLFKSGQETGNSTYQTLALYNGDTQPDGNRNFDLGLYGGTNFIFGTDNAPTSTGIPQDANVHLFVVKFDLSAAALSDSVTVWVDPVLDAGEPAGGIVVSAKDLTWDRLAFSDYDGNSADWDEIRWGTDFASVTTQTVLPPVPTFTLQPTGYDGDVGDTVVLVAQADSEPAPTFQWEKSSDGISGWTSIDGANASTLEFSPASYLDSGVFYRMIATNTNGSVTSEVVQVNLVYPQPEINVQPVSTEVEAGSNVPISVVATGLRNLTYQWLKNGDPISGETTDTLLLVNVQETDEGDYSVRITDDAATTNSLPATEIESSLATLSVYPAPSGLISYDPFDTSAGYAIGELPGQNPTINGYAGAWTDIDFGNAEPAVAAGSLAYGNPLYLGSSGDKVVVLNDVTGGEVTDANSGRVFRALDVPLKVTPLTSGVRYLSFLFRSGQETANAATVTYQALALYNANTADENRNFDIGLYGGANFIFGTDNAPTSTGVPQDANVHLLVVKFELSASPSMDKVTVWIDPTLGGGDPSGGTVVTGAELTWDRLALSDYEGNSAAWDEIRWGTSFDTVTLNPNPPDNFAAWIGGFNVGTLTGFNDDADGDGIKNGLENVFGTDPSVSNLGVTQIATSANTVTFQHPQSGSSASDVTAAYKWSTDLATFQASGATNGGTTVTITPALNTPTAGTTTVTATVTGTQPSKLFLVLEANQVP